jgi:hypothetical protein
LTNPTKFSPGYVQGWPVSASGLSWIALSVPDIEMRHYSAKGDDKQTPHDRDELYFVISGHVQFERAGARVAFKAGDARVLFYGSFKPASPSNQDFAGFSANME